MKVAQLIRKLTRLPMDAEVWVSDWRGVENKVASIEPGYDNEEKDGIAFAILNIEEEE